jgi:hypothetical protein
MEKEKYFIFKNFISEEECYILSNWILKNFQTNVFINSEHPGTRRKTTRFSNIVEYPNTAYEIRERVDQLIFKTVNVESVNRLGAYPESMYASYGYENDLCVSHKDPAYIPGTKTYHFNIILSDYENGKLVIEDTVIDLEKKDGILYPVSDLEHSTTKLTGDKPRLFWSFGYCIKLIN